jgi:hypothetical protein
LSLAHPQQHLAEQSEQPDSETVAVIMAGGLSNLAKHSVILIM